MCGGGGGEAERGVLSNARGFGVRDFITAVIVLSAGGCWPNEGIASVKKERQKGNSVSEERKAERILIRIYAS